MSVLIVLLIVFNFWAPIFALFFHDDGFNLSFVNPRVIYDNIKVNWFGAILLTIVVHILQPASAVIYWLYKLCTVGRKD